MLSSQTLFGSRVFFLTFCCGLYMQVDLDRTAEQPVAQIVYFYPPFAYLLSSLSLTGLSDKDVEFLIVIVVHLT